MIQVPKIGLSGHYKVGVIRASGKYEQLAEFDNLITDAGLDGMASNATETLTQFCRAGTGTTPPANGQTTLVSPLGSASGAGTVVVTTSGGTPVWFQTMTRVFTFAIGAVVGNVAELGVFNATSGGIMFSRALVKDGSGNPTTITILADEQLVVTYALRIYPPTTDVTGTFSATINGAATPIDYAIRAANVDDVNSIWAANRGPFMVPSQFGTFLCETSTLGPVTEAPSGARSYPATATFPAYTGGTFYRDTTTTTPIGNANYPTGVGSCAFAGAAGTDEPGFQISFTPKIPKNNLTTLTLTFRISWGRYVA